MDSRNIYCFCPCSNSLNMTAVQHLYQHVLHKQIQHRHCCSIRRITNITFKPKYGIRWPTSTYLAVCKSKYIWNPCKPPKRPVKKMLARILKLRQPWEVFEFTNSNCWLYTVDHLKRHPAISYPLLKDRFSNLIYTPSFVHFPSHLCRKSIMEMACIARTTRLYAGIFGLRGCVMLSSLLKRITIRWLIYLPDVVYLSDRDPCLCALLYLFISLWFLRWTQRAEVFVVYRTFIS